MVHFEDKLLRLEGMMKTGEGRRMARVRSERVAVFKGWMGEEMMGVAGAGVDGGGGGGGGEGALVDDHDGRRVSGGEDLAGRQLMDTGDDNDDTGEGDERSGDGSCCDGESE